jgi:ferredoxin
MISIDEKKCDECGTCIGVCPVDAIVLDAGIAIDSSVCISCGKCVSVCPAGALSMKTPERKEQIHDRA